MSFWKFSNQSESVELRIDGDITDDRNVWLYEWYGEKCTAPNAFREELARCSGKPITVWIDSYGGDVAAAAGIYNALKEHGGVRVKIDGKAMSAASLIAMAGDVVEMGPAALMMVHNPLMSVDGYASDLRRAANVLDEVKEAIINAYQLKTGKTREELWRLMEDETYMSAKTAIKEGFADGMLYEKEGREPVDIVRSRITNAALAAARAFIDFTSARDQERDKALLLIDLV